MTSCSSNMATEVPVKIELTRCGVVTERRRVRLVEPRFEDLLQCVRQWACGEFAVRYHDSDDDEVTMDTEDEWRECVALWQQDRHSAGAAADGHARSTLRVTVELSPNAPRAQRDGGRRCWRGARHGDDAAPLQRMMLALHRARVLKHRQHQQACGSHAAAEAADDMQGVRLAGRRGPWWRRHAAGADRDTPQGECAAEGCTRQLSGVHPTHCCKKCAHHAGEHGPRCGHAPRPADGEREGERAAAPAGCEAWLCQSGCGMVVSDEGATHCCKRCARHSGQHGPRCSKMQSATDTSGEDEVRATDDGAAAAAVCASEGCTRRTAGGRSAHCCRKCARRGAGQHGPRCRDAGCVSAEDQDAAAEAVPAVEAADDVQHTHAAVAREDAAGADESAGTCAAEGCTRQLNGVHPTHCCKKCARHAGQHGPRCQRAQRKAAAEAAEHSAEDAREATADVPADVNERAAACDAVQEDASGEVVVVALPVDEARTEAAVGEPCEADSPAVQQLRAMGFEITDEVRAVLARSGGNVAAVLEQLL